MILVGWVTRNDRGTTEAGFVDAYAAAAGFVRIERVLAVDGERTLRLVWLGPPAVPHRAARDAPGTTRFGAARPGARLAFGTVSAEPLPVGDDPGTDSQRDIRVTVAADGGLALSVPWVSPLHLYYRVADGGDDLCFSTDLRLFASARGAELDQTGLAGLLQYGLTPAPYSLVAGVRRLAPGHVLRMPLRADATASVSPLPLPCSDADITAVAAREALVTDLRAGLDGIVGTPVVLFSGGVDSALLAAELVDLGRRDTVLLNCSFGADDPEAQLARTMADRLGLAFEQVEVTAGSVGPMLERIGRDYLAPFGDSSVLPMNTLVRGGLPYAPSDAVLVDGSGADVLFGDFDETTPLTRLPRAARTALGLAYLGTRAYQRPGPTEERLRRAQESRAMSVRHLLVFGEQSAEGVYYRLDRRSKRLIEDALAAQLAAHPLDEHAWFVLANASLVVADRVLPKSHGPVLARGGSIAFPFLEPAQVALGLRLPDQVKNGQPGAREAKRLMKGRLAELLPPEWVYRKKSGFSPPLSYLLLAPEAIAYVEDVVLHPDNPLLAHVDAAVVGKLYRAVQDGRPMSRAMLASLWKLLFLSVWWRQQRELSDTAARLTGVSS